MYSSALVCCLNHLILILSVICRINENLRKVHHVLLVYAMFHPGECMDSVAFMYVQQLPGSCFLVIFSTCMYVPCLCHS